MPQGSDPLLMVAGEASGDLHGARLLAELRRERPGVAAFGLGGDELVAAGLEPVAHSSEISVVGLFEALAVLRRARAIFAALLREVERRRPAVAVLIDSPEFNLRLAKALRQRGVRVVYYISPQVWAWRRRRVETIARVVDRMLVLFPFEADFYRRHGVDAVHVGHPLVDEVPELANVWQRPGGTEGPFRIALLPGSRNSEVAALLEPLLGAVEILARRLPIEVRLIRAPTIAPGPLAERTARAAIPIEIVPAEDRFAALADSHLALTASGTATLEVGLLGTPLAMVYRLAAWTYFLALRLVKLPYVSLVNLVLGREVVPELIQHEARPERIAQVAFALLTDAGRRQAMQEGLRGLRPALGAPGASRRAAAEVAAVMSGGTAAAGLAPTAAAGGGARA
jgi:lipid-A-disaccharide synthase